MLAKATSLGASALEAATATAIVAKEKATATASVAKEKAMQTATIVQAKATEAKVAAYQVAGKQPPPSAENPSADGETDSGAETESEGLLNDVQTQCKCFPNLTKKERIQGAIGCYVAGAIFSFLSTLLMFGGAKHVKGFAFFYTLGNICSISSSMFLTGFLNQFKVMCMPIRRVACIVWISSMLATIIVACTMSRAGLLVLLLVFIQYCAMLWYGASFIPYGRAMLKKICSKAATTASNAV
ncbi:transmembrane protein [Thraustotheca clavata]|uniref:Vesicle transport protein n=1 Tax=Thraustotheca clavata TaxID=74557 RepID=A0A1W0A4P6_9STRA|nr:transmembrane protein [Thraustotheca clavata]